MPSVTWTPLRITVVVAAVLVPAAAIVLDRYGGELFWPGIVGEFAATLLAVILALEIETRRERSRLERVAAETTRQRTTEARKRLLAVRRELEANAKSIGEIAQHLGLQTPGVYIVGNPQLLDRAWLANSERLGDLLADYGLMSDLAFFYGRVEELRWRVRVRTETGTDALDGMIRGLVGELEGEGAELLDRVGSMEPAPDVRAVGVHHSLHLGGGI